LNAVRAFVNNSGAIRPRIPALFVRIAFAPAARGEEEQQDGGGEQER
jgi:hypothetical protein